MFGGGKGIFGGGKGIFGGTGPPGPGGPGVMCGGGKGGILGGILGAAVAVRDIIYEGWMTYVLLDRLA